MAERDYKKEYREYHGKPKQRKRRSGRNIARRIMTLAGKAKKGDGKDVHHKDGNPGNNKQSNLRIESRKKNRGRK
tara:strand:+ start:1591 stop:1815 length:225 start_codon:yes stop_codon:yes gene_type:complete